MLALLIQTLARLYPMPADWIRVTTTAGLNFAHLIAHTSSLNFWHAAVHEATHQRATLDLVTVAYSEYPHDPHLSDLLAFYSEVNHGQ